MVATELSKQQALDADPRTKQQIKLTGNLSGINNKLTFIHY